MAGHISMLCVRFERTTNRGAIDISDFCFAFRWPDGIGLPSAAVRENVATSMFFGSIQHPLDVVFHPVAIRMNRTCFRVVKDLRWGGIFLRAFMISRVIYSIAEWAWVQYE